MGVSVSELSTEVDQREVERTHRFIPLSIVAKNTFRSMMWSGGGSSGCTTTGTRAVSFTSK